jgi:uncharacterized protein (TIGR02145 family)
VATVYSNVITDGGLPLTERGICWSKLPEPTLAVGKDSIIKNKAITGSLSNNIENLTPGEKYFVRAYATNNTGTSYGSTLSFTRAEKVADIDNNIYKIAEIGSQIWMAENLRTTRYSNGVFIPNLNTLQSWDTLSATGKAYCYYNNEVTNATIYGALYTWAAAMNGAASSTANPSKIQGVCPTNWHLPSITEWETLVNFLGGNSVAVNKLKEAGPLHWNSNPNSTNESGFTALGSGGLWAHEQFYDLKGFGYWWSATEDNSLATQAKILTLSSSIYFSPNFKVYGFSVRCVKD